MMNMSDQYAFRPARVDDASLLAQLVNFAGEGIPYYLWKQMAAPGETAWRVGIRRAAREDGSFSYTNATLIEQHGTAVGALIGYMTPETPEPVPPDMPPMFAPLQELENLAPATWYINVLAVMPNVRRLGLGTRLLTRAEQIGTDLGARGMSVIVSDSNAGARNLYERLGFIATAHRTMVKDGWVNDGQNWILMTKETEIAP